MTKAIQFQILTWNLDINELISHQNLNFQIHFSHGFFNQDAFKFKGNHINSLFQLEYQFENSNFVEKCIDWLML